jgi:hypothetical protein
MRKPPEKDDIVTNPISKTMFFALSAAALLWVAPAGAQDSRMRMEIPFTFVAGGHVLPAGHYWVTVDQDFGRCLFAGQADSTAQMIRLSPVTDNRPLAKAEQGTLRFTRYGGQHFLSNVWRPGQRYGNRVVASRRLLEAAKSKVSDGGGSPTETDVVAPN